MQPVTIDALIVELAGPHGVVSRRALLAAGIDGNSIDARIHSGLLRRIRPGVYRIGDARPTRRGIWLGDVLACGPASGLGGTTGLQLLGAMRENRRRTVVITARRGRRRPRGIDLRESRGVEFIEYDSIPVTPLPRALADAADDLDDEQLEAAYERAIVDCDLDPSEIPTRNARLNRLVKEHALGTALTDSELENLFRRILKRAGLPQPVSNRDVWTGERYYKPDFLWPERKVIVEILGWMVHRGQRSADGRRTADLMALGFHVIEFLDIQLTRRPHEIPLALTPFL